MASTLVRRILSPAAIHSSIAKTVARESAAVTRARAAINQHDVVVLGMKMNPYPARAVESLKSANVKSITYLEYGSYFSQWKERQEIKAWTGWPTFPQVFINGRLVGGADDVETLRKTGQLPVVLAEKRDAEPV